MLENNLYKVWKEWLYIRNTQCQYPNTLSDNSTSNEPKPTKRSNKLTYVYLTHIFIRYSDKAINVHWR